MTDAEREHALNDLRMSDKGRPLFEAVKAALEAAGLKPDVAEVTMRPENPIELTGDEAIRMQKLLDAIEDLDDVQGVYHNAEMDAE